MVNKRLNYIDALRGLAMILVVFVHVDGFCFFDLSYITFLGSVISLIHLPLFFFISGFVAFRRPLPDMNDLSSKVQPLLCPMIVVGLIYTYYFINKDIGLFIADTAKLGYWFTLVLFEMYLLYYGFRYVSYRWKLMNYAKWIWGLVVLSMIMYLGKYPMRMIEPLNVIGNILSLHYTMNYFQFFVMGLVFALYKEKLKYPYLTFLNKGYWKVALLLLFLSVAYYKYYYWDVAILTNGGWEKICSMLLGTFCSYCGIVGIFFFFKNKEKMFSKKTKWVSALIFIGRRTLDIYLLHYFFIAHVSLVEYGTSLKSNLLLEILVTGCLTLVVIFCSLLLSFLIRKNVFLAKWVLGVKTK